MRNLKLTIEYDGAGLCGWARQKNGPSVQGHIERALKEILREPIDVNGASRTDAGVHALAQVASFQTDNAISTYGLRRGLNSHLPDEIAVIAADEVPPEFHARFSSCGKHYRYAIYIRPERSPLQRLRAWHRPKPVDVPAMQRAAAQLVGQHDFAGFQKSGSDAKTTIRTVTGVDVENQGEWVHVLARGNGFLRHMVRIVTGTLIDIGEGRLPPQVIAEVLETGDRTRAGQTAPAHGLTLIAVDY